MGRRRSRRQLLWVQLACLERGLGGNTRRVTRHMLYARACCPPRLPQLFPLMKKGEASGMVVGVRVTEGSLNANAKVFRWARRDGRAGRARAGSGGRASHLWCRALGEARCHAVGAHPG